MVNQSTQKDSQPTDIDDPIARDILQCCGPAAVEAYNRGRTCFFGNPFPIGYPFRRSS